MSTGTDPYSWTLNKLKIAQRTIRWPKRIEMHVLTRTDKSKKRAIFHKVSFPAIFWSSIRSMWLARLESIKEISSCCTFLFALKVYLQDLYFMGSDYFFLVMATLLQPPKQHPTQKTHQFKDNKSYLGHLKKKEKKRWSWHQNCFLLSISGYHKIKLFSISMIYQGRMTNQII